MDFFASLFTITSIAPEHELEPSAPIDADLGGGNFSACNVAHSEAHRRQRALASGPAADARRLRDAVLHREQQRRYRAWIVASARTHALDKLTPADTTANSRTCTEPDFPVNPKRDLKVSNPSQYFLLDILLPTPSPTPPLPLDGQLSRVRDLHRARQTGIVLPLLPAPDVESADTTPPAVIKLRSQRPPNILIVKRNEKRNIYVPSSLKCNYVVHSTFGGLLQSDMRGSTSSVGWTTKAREREREIDVNNELLALIELE
ncbi:hypothetical protein BJV77DRAFT_1159730 [Russula vinacea]|nr:hypothetical protein BJV77DRAFT_1159730 [Russula vinacea]